MSVIYVTSDQPGAGKTALCSTLARRLASEGRTVAAIKPIAGPASGDDADPDPGIYEHLLGNRHGGEPAVVPSSGLDDDTVSAAAEAVGQLAADNDIVIVEGADGLSPSEAGRVAEALDARTVLMVRFRPDLASEDLKPWQDAIGSRLAGCLINGLSAYQGTAAASGLVPALESSGMTMLGVVPEDRRMLAVQVGDIARHLDGRFLLGENKSDTLVEHVMVGGQSLDAGELYFGIHDSKAVVVRGDRPDIQMAALNTPTACMVITKGIEPIEYVTYEASEEDVPVMLVQTDTIATMEALDTVQELARFDHPAKLERFAELLDGNTDLPAIYAAVGLAG